MNSDKNNIYKFIVEHMGEEIFVSDGEGNILFVNPASIEVNELDAKNVIGKNVKNLVEEGYFSDSSTLRVLDKKKPVSILQTLKNNKQVIATGTPVFDDDGKISMVISTSKDIEAVTVLLDTLQKQEAEIKSLKNELSSDSTFIANDPSTQKLSSLLEKVSSLDTPILISGETGTGKSFAARVIHFEGNRRSNPLLTVNCFHANDNSIEEEIFGSNSIPYSGNHNVIKKGKLEFADNGTLVLNNIEDLPLKVQSKLCEYIKTGSFTRFKGTKPVHVNTRIVCTTSCDLRSMCENRTFKPELYYALNSISVPPLRSRLKDIPFLAKLYLSKCNSKYGGRKMLSSSALGVLASHTWPGNFLEFSQTIESSYIITDGHVISGDTIYSIIHNSPSSDESGKVICTDIIPLKEAKHQVEEQLVKRAYEVYKTTYKAAEILKVDQSTVAKALKKYRTDK